MKSIIQICNYALLLEINYDKHQCLFPFLSKKIIGQCDIIDCIITDYRSVYSLVEKYTIFPKLSCYRGGGSFFYLTYIGEFNLIVFSDYSTNKIYISEGDAGFRKSSGYLLYTILKDHIVRRTFAEGKIPLHATLLTYKNEYSNSGVLLFGSSGSGKSTLAYLLHKYLHLNIISDDLCVFNSQLGLVNGYCQSLFLNSDIVAKYNLVHKCVRVNKKHKCTVGNVKETTAPPKIIVFLTSRDTYMHLTSGEMIETIMKNSKEWCKTDKEFESFKSVSTLVMSSSQLILTSYKNADQVIQDISSLIDFKD